MFKMKLRRSASDGNLAAQAPARAGQGAGSAPPASSSLKSIKRTLSYPGSPPIDSASFASGGIPATEALNQQWSRYLADQGEEAVRDFFCIQKRRIGGQTMKRHQALLESAALSLTDKWAIKTYTLDSDADVNNFLRYGKTTRSRFSKGSFPAGVDISLESPAARARQLVEVLKKLPSAGNITLYRGGNGFAGTSGRHFRSGALSAGDILVNNDFLSFTENPFTTASFAKMSEQETDDTSVIFQLSKHRSAKPIAPLSGRIRQNEDESLYSPMHFFKIIAVRKITPTINGSAQPLILVFIEEMPRTGHTLQIGGNGLAPEITYGERYFDFRTGEPFDYGAAMARLTADEEQ